VLRCARVAAEAPARDDGADGGGGGAAAGREIRTCPWRVVLRECACVPAAAAKLLRERAP